ncbi:hypothetical protein EDD29_6215 [Actinocorallia herbida]|uniref:Uncharacterized protein n=1 Tax=Actinocorallia herbida TaxID=58109 RepID=A0A3N1D4S6_9ACTN|nr:hypothetical protein [Actinocorallia herbida]ROO88544.1 hypothetical protein EDD29_6215 [Actinocorallia herbida]
MSLDRYRWDQKAQQLRFQQLEVVRRQAESWRTGLAGVTALLGAVLVVKGREGFADLADPFRWIVAALLAAGLALLVAATLRALSAASGSPSGEILLTGEDLESWTGREVMRVRRGLRFALGATVAGIILVAGAVGVTWFAPSAKPAGTLLEVRAGSALHCGRLVRAGDGVIVVEIGRTLRVLPLDAVTAMETVEKCP